jgi:hypothetical protein
VQEKNNMDKELASLGYRFVPAKYSPNLGYSELKTVISGCPTQRYFDVKALHVPTFDGRFYHKTQITRHELEPKEHFQVCIGELSLENRKGEHLQAFSFGGSLQVALQGDDLLCNLTSTAPIFRLKSDPGSLGGGLLADEILEMLAEIQVGLSRHEDELYARLAGFDPYQLFLSCLVTLQKRVDSIPQNLRTERVRKAASAIHNTIQIVQKTDGWDGHSPELNELLSKGGS